MFMFNAADYAELERLYANGMRYVLCDFRGQRWAYGDAGVTEKLKKGVLMCVSPTDYHEFVIADALRARKGER